MRSEPRFWRRRDDAYDNALAETINGLYKAEVIHHLGQWKGLEDVEYATLEWVAWYNTQRLMAPLGHVPPAEYEEQYPTVPGLTTQPWHSTNRVSGETGAIQRESLTYAVSAWGKLTH